VVRGVSIEKNQAKVTVQQLPDEPGRAAMIFQAISDANIVIDMIVQSDPVGAANEISFTLNREELPKARAILEPLLPKLGAKAIATHEGVAKLSIIGVGMRSHGGVAAKFFGAISTAGINIQLISTSEIKTAVIIDEARVAEGARLVCEAFGLVDVPQG
jgi:aspartate kinase